MGYFFRLCLLMLLLLFALHEYEVPDTEKANSLPTRDLDLGYFLAILYSGLNLCYSCIYFEKYLSLLTNLLIKGSALPVHIQFLADILADQCYCQTNISCEVLILFWTMYVPWAKSCCQNRMSSFLLQCTLFNYKFQHILWLCLKKVIRAVWTSATIVLWGNLWSCRKRDIRALWTSAMIVLWGNSC
jgi:hypothetical protein